MIRVTSSSKEDRHLERLCLDNVRTRACTSRRESTRDSVYTVQRAGKDEVLVGSELSQAIYPKRVEHRAQKGCSGKRTGNVTLINEPAGFVYHLFTLKNSVWRKGGKGHTHRPKMAIALSR